VNQEVELLKSMYEDFDDFDFDDNKIGKIGIISDNSLIQKTFVSILKLQRTKDKVNITELKAQRGKLVNLLQKRKKKIKAAVKTAYYRRLYDKVVYMVGILLLWNFAFYLGRYPEDFIF
jgi:hypothetical protein